MDEQKLLDCPFCGENKIRILFSGIVICEQCGATVNSVYLWNERKQPSAGVGLDELNFRRGYYCAVANLHRMHNIGVEKELLQQYGKLNFDGIDEYDVKTIREIIK